MRQPFPLLVLCLLVSAAPARAELINLGNGMIYDTVQDLTWLQDTRFAWTSGYDNDPGMTNAEAHTWVDQLVYGGYDDWRLPVGRSSFTFPERTLFEYPWSEISGVLQQLGWHWERDEYGGWHYNRGGLGPFVNFDHPVYRYFQFWAEVGEPGGSDVWHSGWDYDVSDGGENNRHTGAWAVRDGLARVPEPSTLLTLTLGAFSLLSGRHRRPRDGRRGSSESGGATP